MIGLALITGVAVLTASLLATFDDLLEDALTADLFIFEEAQGLDFSPVLVEQLDALDETDVVAAFAGIELRVDEDVVPAAAFDTDTGDAVVDVGITDGTANISTSGIGVFTEVAAEKDLSVGSTVPVEFEDGFTTDLTVEAIYDDKSIAGTDWVVNRELSRQHVEADVVSFIGVTFPEGADVASSREAVEELTASFPQLAVQDNTEFQEQVESQVNQLQIVINGLLVLCLVVAFFGIVNTMALSVLERTREIGSPPGGRHDPRSAAVDHPVGGAGGERVRCAARCADGTAAWAGRRWWRSPTASSASVGIPWVSARDLRDRRARSSAWSPPTSPPAEPPSSTCSTPSPTSSRLAHARWGA